MLSKPVGWGCITEYRRYGIRPIKEGRHWIADNGCFSGSWDKHDWIIWLHKMLPYVDTCDFATLPDVMGDHKETLHRYAIHYHQVKEMGYKCAFVCQDGCEPKEIPSCDAVFIGGSTEFKMSKEARDCMIEAKHRGIPVHIGRVNSAKRYAYFLLNGADSFDGTKYIYEPDAVTKEVERWAAQKTLWRPNEINNFQGNGRGEECNKRRIVS
jgi:hypothetical protein